MTVATTPETFAQALAQIPFTANTQNGAGFLPPMMRAIGHVLYVVGCVADETIPVTDADVIAELEAAGEHWNARTPTTAISTSAAARATALGTLIEYARLEYAGWPETEREGNLRSLANRLYDFTAFLDRELTGLTGSDAGSLL